MPNIIAKSFTKAHTLQYLTDLFRSWDKISEEAKDLFRQEWKKKISSKVKQGKNRLRNLVFLESTAKEMGIYFNEGFHLELPELEDYLEYSIQNKNTAETAVLLDYKNKTFDKTYLEKLETRKEMLDIGLELPTLKELRKKWTVRVSKEYITLTGYKGKDIHEVIPEAIDTGLPIRYLSTTRDFFQSSSYNPIERLVLPENFEGIPTRCFNSSTLREIILPKSMISVPDSLCSEAKNLQKIDLHEGICKIECNAFRSCFMLEEVAFPESLEYIDDFAFKDCWRLSEIIIPKNVKSIGKETFAGCNILKKVILAHDTTEIDPTAFSKSPKLEFVGTENGENLLHKFREE